MRTLLGGHDVAADNAADAGARYLHELIPQYAGTKHVFYCQSYDERDRAPKDLTRDID